MNAQTREEYILTGSIVIGAAGAIASTTGLAPNSATTPGVVKTNAKTGRYSIALDAKYITLRFLGAPGLVGPTDAAIATADIAYYRNRTTSGFDIQCCLGGTDTDANPTSGTEIHWAIVVRDL